MHEWRSLLPTGLNAVASKGTLMSAHRWLDVLVGDAEVEERFSDAADLAALLRVETALAEAEADVGLIPAAAAARIADVCATFVPDQAALAQDLAKDGVVIPGLVKQLRAAVGAPHAVHLHQGATSQDIIDTSLTLRLCDVVALLDDRLARLIEELTALKAREGSKAVIAHTRMQVALPFTAADKIDSWMAPLGRHRSRLRELKPRLLVLQLGGPVGTRAELQGKGDVIAGKIAARLGLGAVPCWHSQRDNLAEFGAMLSLITGALGKLGADIALLAQNELAAVTLARAGSSSAMKHKQNPVAAEVLVALARFNAGLLGTLHQSLVHENERSGAAWTLEWMVLPRMAIAAGAALRSAAELLDGLHFT
jgi:3-carboxy-cis,cis-muconate cycloisomerase